MHKWRCLRDAFKKAKVWPHYKKDGKQKNQTRSPSMSIRMFQKFMKDACTMKDHINFILILIKYQGIKAVFVKVLTHHIYYYV